MLKTIKSLLKDEQGATAVEYALVIGLISVGIIAGARTLGTTVQGMFDQINTALSTAETAE